MDENKFIPGADTWTLTVNDKNGKPVTIHLKDLDRTTYKVVSTLVAKDELQGVESLLNSLWIGGDDVKLITQDFKALRNASVTILPMLQAEAGELKKN